MKGLSQAVKVGILVTIMVVGSYAVWKAVGSKTSGDGGYTLWAHFRDASGLPVGSKVSIAGLPVGEIDGLSVDGRYAKITMRVRDGTKVWDNAIVLKKSASLLGDYYLEIDPGAPESVTAAGQAVAHELLRPGPAPSDNQIKHVVEATSPDQLMRTIEEAMPKVEAVLVSVRQLTEDVRALVNGPIASATNRLDRLIQEQAGAVENVIGNLEVISRDFREVARDVRAASGGLDDRIAKLETNLTTTLDEYRTLATTGQREIEETGTKLREKLDLVDDLFESSASVAGKLDRDEGTLGRLINDSTLADNLEDITADASGFVRTLFGMQTYVGLRSEYNVWARQLRHYISIELATRHDKYYLIELEKGPRGNYPDVELVYDPAAGAYRRDVRIKDEIRFTFQFAKRLDWLTVRYGLKESTGGVGLDGTWFDGRLILSVDVFDATFDAWPRLKVAAAYRAFSHLYLLAGVDEVLNSPDELPIVPHPFDVPIQFEEFRFGRDMFFGAMLKFNDLDLAALLTVGGSALSAATE